jgi:multiple sugar transport system ATP-binding protein
MASVEIQNLTKSFKGPRGESLRAVHDVSLKVADKELLALLGPSGCGKTTLLRLIAGLEEPDQGVICIDGKPVSGVAPKDRDIAMVFQNHALYPHLSVRENLAFGLKARGYPRQEIEARVGEAAQMLELSQCLERRPGELSGGQRQRVALGRAIVRRPKVFLFDEPLSNLDAPMRAQLRIEIARLHAQLGSTMLYVTHDQVEAMMLGDRIAVMREGVIQQIADRSEIYRHPANLFVAGFVGSPPMNFFHGQIAQRDGALFFETLRLDPNWGAKLASYAGRKVILGLRPEHITRATSDLPGRTIEANVEAVQPVGPETYLCLRSGAYSFVARVPATDDTCANQQVTLAFAMTHASFFDLETGQAIGPNPA